MPNLILADLRSEITVDEIRKLQSFFHLSAAEGGRRGQESAGEAASEVVRWKPPDT